jgi:hypothetical protein
VQNEQPGDWAPRDFFREPREGVLTKQIEAYTARVPSLFWFGLAVGSMGLSAGLAAFTKRKYAAHFIGLWVPSLMLIGIYNKLVKLEGSDRFSRGNIH